MSKKEHDFTEESVEAVEGFLAKAEFFFEKHRRIIYYVVAGIAIIVAILLGVKYLYIEPREKASAEEMFYAEQYFGIDSLQWAMNGDGQHYGFIDIIDNYGNTKAGNLSRYYAGICYLRMHEYEEAAHILKKFKSSDAMLSPLSQSLIGDAYVELKDFESAAKYYHKASELYPSDFLTPGILMKAAFAYEQTNDFKNALKCYETLRNDYPQSNFASEVEISIGRMKAKIE